MPHILVMGVPRGTNDAQFNELEKDLIAAARSVEQLGLKQSDLLVNFIDDARRQYVSTEIIVRVSEFWAKPERTPEVRGYLAQALLDAVQSKFPYLNKICVYLDKPFNKEEDGFAEHQRLSPSTLITELGLPGRVTTHLKNAGIDTLGELENMPWKQYRLIEHMGDASRRMVDEMLIAHGYEPKVPK